MKTRRRNRRTMRRGWKRGRRRKRMKRRRRRKTKRRTEGQEGKGGEEGTEGIEGQGQLLCSPEVQLCRLCVAKSLHVHKCMQLIILLNSVAFILGLATFLHL